MSTFVPQRVVVAPSGFKESLSAVEVAEAIAAGVRRVLPGVVVDKYPVPDGGEGTVEILATRPDASLHSARVTGPVGQPVVAEWVMINTQNAHGEVQKTAVLEMASAAGLSLVPRDLRDPGATTTYGVGELIRHALDAGAEKIIVGCGDSGTCDGGVGALAALGVEFEMAAGVEYTNTVPAPLGKELASIVAVDIAGLDPRLSHVNIDLACNVHNVLTGPQGVARVFGPQKGATPQQVEALEQGLEHLAELLESALSPAFDLFRGRGSGASGGLGAGLAAIGAKPRDRFEVFLSSSADGKDLSALIERADLVITAEGAIDFQTPRGKVPAEVAARAQATGVPVLAIAGSLGEGAPQVHDVGIGAIASIMTVPMNLEDAVRDSRNLLANAAERTMRVLLLGSAMAGQMSARAMRPMVGAQG